MILFIIGVFTHLFQLFKLVFHLYFLNSKINKGRKAWHLPEEDLVCLRDESDANKVGKPEFSAAVLCGILEVFLGYMLEVSFHIYLIYPYRFSFSQIHFLLYCFSHFEDPFTICSSKSLPFYFISFCNFHALEVSFPSLSITVWQI